MWASVRSTGLLGNRNRLRADAGTLVIQRRPDGAAARFLLKGRAVAIRLSRGSAGELILWSGALQPEAARLIHRRPQEAARRLRLQVDVVGALEFEAVRA